ncbi:MAG: enoyl-CoA hydratase/isomerase family protein [Mycobacteriales bacterium]
MTDREFVRVEVADAVATIRLDRPKMNILNTQMQEEVRAAAQQVTDRSDVRAVVVYGGDQVFAAGADIKEMVGMSHAEMTDRAGGLSSAFDSVARIPKPVIAAITGYALGGGCELALTADLRVCAEDAQLGQPEISLGIIPGAGGTQRLPRLIGPSRAKELIYTGRMVAAAEALGIGLVDVVTPAAEVYDRALAMARRFGAGPADALRAAKAAIDGGLDTDLATGLRLESHLFAGLFGTEDRAIGMKSFLRAGPGKATFVGR